MGKRGHSEEEILRVLREAESGETVVEVCRKHGISQQSFYLWKKKYAGLGLSELRELLQLREENGCIESFNGKLRDECLNVEVFFTLADARRKLGLWQHDYNHHRPHSALADRTPAEFAAVCSGGNDGDKTALENASRFPHFPRTATAAGISLTSRPISSPLLEVTT